MKTYFSKVILLVVLWTFVGLGHVARAQSTKITIECNKNPSVICVLIPGNGIDIAIMHGPANIKSSVTYTPPAPACNAGWTPYVSMFAFTNESNPDEGYGVIDGQVCVSGNQEQIEMYQEESPMYTSHATWQAALP